MEGRIDGCIVVAEDGNRELQFVGFRGPPTRASISEKNGVVQQLVLEVTGEYTYGCGEILL